MISLTVIGSHSNYIDVAKILHGAIVAAIAAVVIKYVQVKATTNCPFNLLVQQYHLSSYLTNIPISMTFSYMYDIYTTWKWRS